jgi:hypothetical protein
VCVCQGVDAACGYVIVCKTVKGCVCVCVCLGAVCLCQGVDTQHDTQEHDLTAQPAQYDEMAFVGV